MEWFIELLQMRQDKIDTQGMSIPSKGNTNSRREIPPMPVKHRTIFTPEERRELKDIVNEPQHRRGPRKSPCAFQPIPRRRNQPPRKRRPGWCSPPRS